jgi:predicted nuclease of predicted toxin-antitoxin system
MRIKLDENLPVGLVGDLQALGHDVDTVPSEALAGRPDPDVWKGAQAAMRMLVTQDLDFSDIRVFGPGTHHGLVLVRLREPGRAALRARIGNVFRTEPVDTWDGCLVVLSDPKGSRATTGSVSGAMPRASTRAEHDTECCPRSGDDARVLAERAADVTVAGKRKVTSAGGTLRRNPGSELCASAKSVR